MLASDEIILPMRVATIVVPVAVYFLILGLLNSRRHPQLLSARLDFALLTGALSPLLAVPAIAYIGSPPLAAAALVAMAAGVSLLAGPRRSWVIYNISEEQARSALAKALNRSGIQAVEEAAGFGLPGGAFLAVSAFPILRNVSVRLHGGDQPTARKLLNELGRALGGMEVQTSPMAVSLLLVAMAMIAAPATLVAHRVPEIARLLIDMLR